MNSNVITITTEELRERIQKQKEYREKIKDNPPETLLLRPKMKVASKKEPLKKSGGGD